MVLAWVLANRSYILPIPGTKRRKYIEDNADAVDIEPTEAEMAEIDAVFPPDAAAGERYPVMMHSVNG
ncbi:hypothetical protein GCM10009087_36470 [Sphingomonas oligophenolica]